MRIARTLPAGMKPGRGAWTSIDETCEVRLTCRIGTNGRLRPPPGGSVPDQKGGSFTDAVGGDGNGAAPADDGDDLVGDGSESGGVRSSSPRVISCDTICLLSLWCCQGRMDARPSET